MRFKALVAFVVGACQAVAVACHGYLDVPAARNVQHWSHYCPQCLNGPGVCGDPEGVHDHEAFGLFANPPRVADTFERGATMRAHVVITANHGGRWGLEVCKLRAGQRELRSCFKRLKRADGRGRYVYVPPSASESTAAFKLPKNLTCERCVVRWRWETGNSCTPKGTPRKYANPGLQTCGTGTAPPMEAFTNCADVRII